MNPTTLYFDLLLDAAMYGNLETADTQMKLANAALLAGKWDRATAHADKAEDLRADEEDLRAFGC